MQAWVTQYRKGLVELCVMAALRDGEAYGYQIVERLGQMPGLAMTESTVYPLLTRLAREQWLAVRSAASPHGPPRRYYRLTHKGRMRLAEMIDHWRLLNQSLETLLNGGQAHEHGDDDSKRVASIAD